MQTDKRILIPTDFSDNAWNTIVYAMQLYKGSSCQFDIVHVYDVHPSQLATTLSSQRIGFFQDLIKKESEAGLNSILDDISNSYPDSTHVFNVHSRKGDFVDVIKDMVNTQTYELICIGTKGATGARALFLGSNTHSLIKNVDRCPILVIPDEVNFSPIRSIVFATDFERIYYKAEIKPIKKIAKQFGAKVCMLHIYDAPSLSHVQNYNSGALDNYFKNLEYEFYVVPNFSGVTKGITSFIDEEDVEMLAMINYKHSFLEELIREAVIRKITFNTKIPFLVIPSDT
ncbi:universal stress protein [Aquimarina intermedia]|uniref:Nucleotide-binding universal stress UspA family protein n=1 Tax=Aquimarina intermedia TaxID=350814 RepID=A0A5S5C4L7_9FLAO|nr:universal stress protein [Aquimarina intermedia]TYP74257.1 nucleotide-binding universal stress UspA family protein [Aquimarina intermedia]